ncbi:MAG TPA: cation:proton antiporter subunit C [Candidatus Krumholzibacterium sp.]|nr:cation:proton antiporter subunit C [Candidatus Krumholzibacterium sp.]
MIRIIIATGFALLLIGIWGLMTRRNLIKMVLSVAVAEVGLQMVMISAGYIRGGGPPILEAETAVSSPMVDPVPQALVLTAIVIGVAVNALMLAVIIRMHAIKGSLDVRDYMESRW